jgi:hypothetical protein
MLNKDIVPPKGFQFFYISSGGANMYPGLHKGIFSEEEVFEMLRNIPEGYPPAPMKSMDEIAARLNQERVAVKIGWESRKWSHSAISYVLSNERYIGNSLWQKTYAPDELSAHHVRNHGERQQYYAEGTHPAIITPEMFQAVQNLKNQRSKHKISEFCGLDTPLRKKLYCGVCGTMFKPQKCRGQCLVVQ